MGHCLRLGVPGYATCCIWSSENYLPRTPVNMGKKKTGASRSPGPSSSHCAPILELPSIGWQLFILGSCQSASTAFLSSLDTSATRLLTEPLRRAPLYLDSSFGASPRLVLHCPYYL